jgi:hypothetical protein
MAKVMKEVKRYSWRPNMRDTGTLVQFSVRNKLHPKGDWVVIKAYEADIALIERGLIKPVLTGRMQPLALHALPQQDREIVILIEIALRENAYPIIYVEQRDQNHKEGVLCAE